MSRVRTPRHNFGAFLVILSFAKYFAASSFYPFLPHSGQWPGHCCHLEIVFLARLAAKVSSIVLETFPESAILVSLGSEQPSLTCQAFDVSQLVLEQKAGHWPGKPSRHCMRLWARHGQPRPSLLPQLRTDSDQKQPNFINIKISMKYPLFKILFSFHCRQLWARHGQQAAAWLFYHYPIPTDWHWAKKYLLLLPILTDTAKDIVNLLYLENLYCMQLWVGYGCWACLPRAWNRQKENIDMDIWTDRVSSPDMDAYLEK